MKFYPYSIFKLEDAFNLGIQFIREVKSSIIGRACGEDWDYGLIAQCVYNSSGGNFLEIGSLFGAGAIVVSKILNHFNFPGKVYVLDPLDGYYGTGNRDMSGYIPSVDILKQNVEKFGVSERIEIVAKKSYPFPKELKDKKFSVSYIDGDHWGEMPYNDFQSVKDITTHYIMFDNYDINHHAVVNACLKSIVDSWVPVHISSISFILQNSPKVVEKFRL